MTHEPDKYAIIFNGPPGSGKDDAARKACDIILDSHHMEFKWKLFELVLAIFNISSPEFFALYNNRDTKEVPTPLLRGFSPRGAMIYVSEEVIKPNFGKHYFGEMAAQNLQYGLNAFSDGGFEEELEPVYDACEGRVLIARIHRPGFTYEGDSRSYIQSFREVPIVDIQNDSTLEIFLDRVSRTVINFRDGMYNIV